MPRLFVAVWPPDDVLDLITELPRPDVEGLRGRVAALCDKRPLYPGFRGYTTYEA